MTNDNDLTRYRVTKLEEAHEELSKTLTSLVLEFKSTKKAVVGIVAIVGVVQPFIFHYLGK